MARKYPPMDKVPAALAKTGFLLEHQVAETFRKGGWYVISNRYYADDVDGRARELDLMAYRVEKRDDVRVVTCFLISCKKDEQHAWAFMSRPKPATDPNFDWSPVPHWTDIEPLASHLQDDNWRSNYVAQNAEVKRNFFNAKRDVFATQLISLDGNSPHNDKPIFDSVVSLLKALDHERSAVKDRQKGKKRVYLFALASVVDAPMVDVQYSGTTGKASAIDRLTHLARFMVNRRETHALIHFIDSGEVTKFVKSATKLSTHSADFMEQAVHNSYEAIKSSKNVQKYFSEKLTTLLKWDMNYALRTQGFRQSVEAISIGFGQDQLILQVDVDDTLAEHLNSDPQVRKETARVLRRHARYTGEFTISPDIPF